MSALPPKGDVERRELDVCFGPQADFLAYRNFCCERKWALSPTCRNLRVDRIEPRGMYMASGDFSVASDQVLKKAMFAALICAFTCPTVHSSAAIRFKRFPHCPEGLVKKKTCECHAGSSGRFHFCHVGENCDTTHGLCHKQ